MCRGAHRRCAVRLALLTVASLLIAATVSADQFLYTFTGTLARTSSLTLSDGTVIDLSGAAFTASGVASGDPADPRLPTLFAATSLYDFGALGSFMTDENADR